MSQAAERGGGARRAPPGAAAKAGRLPAGLLLVALIALAAYHGVFANGFALDDAVNVTGNRIVLGTAPWTDVFRGDYWQGGGLAAGLYRPLFVLSNRALWRVSGGSPAAFHGAVLALHLVNVCLLALLARRLSASTATCLLAAALLAVHPLATDAVCAASGLKEVASLTFVLSATLAAVPPGERRGRLGALVAPAALLLAGLGFRESVVAGVAVAPLAVLACPQTVERRARRRRAAALALALFVPVAIYAGVALAALGTVGRPSVLAIDNPLADAGAGARVAGALALVPRAAGLALWPARLSPDYDGLALPPPASPVSPPVMAGLALLAAAGAALLLGRRRPPVAVGAALLLAGYLPTSNLLFPIGTYFAERFLYLPLAGLALMAAGLPFDRIRPAAARRLALVAALAIVAALAVRTGARVPEWRDRLTLYRAAVEAQPQSGKVQAALGSALRDGGDLPGALRAYTRATELHPGWAQAWAGRAGVLKAMGDLPGAALSLERARALDPEHPIIASNLGNVLRDLGRRDEASRHLDAAVALGGTTPLPPHNRALLRLEQRDVAGARTDLALALDRDPCFAPSLGLLLRAFGSQAAGERLAIYRDRCAGAPGFDPALAAVAGADGIAPAPD